MKFKNKDGILAGFGPPPTCRCSLKVTGWNDLQLDLAHVAHVALDLAHAKTEGGDASGANVLISPHLDRLGGAETKLWGACVRLAWVRHTCALALPGWLFSDSFGSGPGSALHSRAHPGFWLCTVGGPGPHLGELTRNPCCTTGWWSATLPGASVLTRNTPGPDRWQRHLHLLPSPFDCSQDPRTSLPKVWRGEAGAGSPGARGRDGAERGRRRRRRVSHCAPPLSRCSQLACAVSPGPAPGSPLASRRAGNN